ncbi:rod shape-determining protein MreC [Croceicoccus estronivorus]|uniref:rod shape-determining protein MreC n=1 Tax=Croceicoccus estronivorus TaxID=1172626 RepID=UPI0008306C19|nr:rod shape-determining protein MreC [Croceicoccus estronivorus]OCC24590.1 rod shape-determining protein MreC [Croceicoccus estronivorus]
MAPPTSRHSSFSRKAQFSLFTGYVLAGAGALAGAALLAISLFNPGAFSGLRSVASDVAAPAGELGAEARTGSQGLFASLAGYFYSGSRNAALREENEIARIRLAEAEAVRAENARLKALLGLRDDAVKPVVMARLIGSTSSSTRRFAYLSAGRSDGVAPGMPVRSPRGLVGRVLETGASSSRVLLLTDSESLVPVRRVKGDVVAFAEGRADGTLRLRLVNLGINPIKTGDVFVTSGAGGLYRPGIAVAVATKINRDGAIARVLSDPAATDFVAVDPIWQPEAQAVSHAQQRRVQP